MFDQGDGRLLRIGPFSRAVGVSAERLRNWERRYGVPRPRRSEGGFRLYSPDDAQRVRALLHELERGAAPAEAARIALAAVPRPSAPAVSSPHNGRKTLLREALEGYEERRAHGVLDETFGALGVEAGLRDVVLPCMREIGERWARADASVGQEHFASRLVEGRLLAMARGWEDGSGPTVILACPPGELHTIGVIAFGLVVGRLGWRIVYLGADSPVPNVREAAERLTADAVVLGSVEEMRFVDAAVELRALGEETPLYLGGAGANAALAEAAAGRHLEGDAVAAAGGLRAAGGPSFLADS